jgi:hypothetical protein
MRASKGLIRKTPMPRGTGFAIRKTVARKAHPKMTAARKAASGKPCMIRIPGVCCFDSSTTVLCHYRLSTGGGTKPHDTQGAWGCNKCHDAVDGRVKTAYSNNELRLMHAEGVLRTQEAIRREAA